VESLQVFFAVLCFRASDSMTREPTAGAVLYNRGAIFRSQIERSYRVWAIRCDGDAHLLCAGEA
jgi:hypothetical protein